LILFLPVCVKTVFEKGRDFPWAKPEACLACNGRLWGHGWVEGCFDGYARCLELPRYLCPDCGCVVRVRPVGYFSRFQASIETIVASLKGRLEGRGWLPGLSRCRQRHWYRAFVRQVKWNLGVSWAGDLVKALDRLLAAGICPVAGSVQCETPAGFCPPHRRLPFTDLSGLRTHMANPNQGGRQWTSSKKRPSPYFDSG
jgi:hypothetical protein